MSLYCISFANKEFYAFSCLVYLAGAWQFLLIACTAIDSGNLNQKGIVKGLFDVEYMAYAMS